MEPSCGRPRLRWGHRYYVFVCVSLFLPWTQCVCRPVWMCVLLACCLVVCQVCRISRLQLPYSRVAFAALFDMLTTATPAVSTCQGPPPSPPPVVPEQPPLSPGQTAPPSAPPLPIGQPMTHSPPPAQQHPLPPAPGQQAAAAAVLLVVLWICLIMRLVLYHYKLWLSERSVGLRAMLHRWPAVSAAPKS